MSLKLLYVLEGGVLVRPRGALILQIVFEVIQAASFLPVY